MINDDNIFMSATLITSGLMSNDNYRKETPASESAKIAVDMAEALRDEVISREEARKGENKQ